MKYKFGEINGNIIKHYPDGLVDVDYDGTVVTLAESDNELSESCEFEDGGNVNNIDIPEEELLDFIYKNGGIFDIKNATLFAEKYLHRTITSEVGEGSMGMAYLTSEGKVLKFTFSYKEAEFSKELIGKQFNRYAEVYNVWQLGRSGGVEVYHLGRSSGFNSRKGELFAIEKEYLEGISKEDRALLRGMKIILSKSEEHNVSFEEQLENTNVSIWNDVYTPEDKEKMLAYHNEYIVMVDDFEKLNLGVNDLDAQNIGLKNGKLACFDCMYGKGGELNNGGEIDEDAQMYIDVIANNPNSESSIKYKAVLKDKHGIDFDDIYKDEEYIKNANLDDIKKKDDFLNFDNYIRYAKEIFTLRGLATIQPNHLEGDITIEQATEIGKKLNFKVVHKEYDGGSGNLASHDLVDTIIMPNILNINSFIHEVGHHFDHYECKDYKGKAKTITYASSGYLISKNNEVFAENFLYYFIAPEWLEKNLPVVYDELNGEITPKYKEVINGLISKNNKFDDGGNIFSASSRFRPSETIIFDNPIVGKNGAKLISYTWAYEWTEDWDNVKGETIERRISDWSNVDASSDTGRGIVHKFTVELPSGEFKTVSSESVLILLGYAERNELKSFPSLVNAVKTLSKQKLQLAILEDKQKVYDEKLAEIKKLPLPEITKEPHEGRFANKGKGVYTWKMGDVEQWSDVEVFENWLMIPIEKSDYEMKYIKESLTNSWYDKRMKEAGQPSMSYKGQIYDLKKRLERQERKVQQLTERESKLKKGGVVKPTTTKLPFIYKPLPVEKKIIDNINSYDKIIISYSGGKDSDACVLYLMDYIKDKSKIELWHQCVDGRGKTHKEFFDWQSTDGYVEAFAKMLGLTLSYQWREFGFYGEMFRKDEPTHAVRYIMDGKEYVIETKNKINNTRLKFPAKSADLNSRWCSAYLKIDAASRVLANRFQTSKDNQMNILFVTGERREESTGRSKYLNVENHRTNSQTRHVDHFRPVIEWNEKKVWDILKSNNIQPHPAYEVGFPRLSCRSCIFFSPDHWALLKTVQPDVIKMLDKVEKEIGFKLDNKFTIPEMVALGKTNLTDRAKSFIPKLITEWSGSVESNNWELPIGAFHTGGGAI